MKTFYLLLAVVMLVSCQDRPALDPTCDLIDIIVVDQKCDNFRAAGKNAEAAQEYFKAAQANQSSELFVYAAWQFGEADQVDSALIAIKNAIAFGMNSPFIVDKVGIDSRSKDHPLRKEVDLLLQEINQRNASVDNFEVVTTPINRYWSYFDRAVTDTINAEKYLTGFICEGSPALRDYYHIRYKNVDKMKEVMIDRNPAYFTYLKKHFTSERLKTVAVESKMMMQRFADLYPKAIFPKTYIVPDLINGSGTLTELGLFIGADMFAKSDSMPLENLNDWQIATITEYENMKFDLVHELMHFQQSYSDFKSMGLLLGKLIEEGSCDFLVSILTEDQQPSPGVQKNLDYLATEEHYEFIMSELQRDVYSADLSKWMHNGGGIQDRPSNLGYTMGFLICKSYYENSTDKKKAVYELLNTDDFKEIIKGSKFKDILSSS